jgi:hypothetical protein
MTHRNDLKSLRTFAKRFARMKRIPLSKSLDFIADKLGQPHWNAFATAWEKGWRPTNAAREALLNMEETTDPVMTIPTLGIGEGVTEHGELDGHPYVLEIDFEVVMAQISEWCIHIGHAPSDRPIIEAYNMAASNPIFDHAFREKALAICLASVERLRARISADWPRRSTKPDADGHAQHPLFKGVSAHWHCMHCEHEFSGTQMAENLWHCPVCRATPIDISAAPFWKEAS